MEEHRVLSEAPNGARPRIRSAGSTVRMRRRPSRLAIHTAAANYLSFKIFIQKMDYIIHILNFYPNFGYVWHPNFGYVWHSVSTLEKMYSASLECYTTVW